jgi:WD40 repeat protein
MADVVVAWTRGEGAAVHCWDAATGSQVHSCKGFHRGTGSASGVALASSASPGDPRGGLLLAACDDRPHVLVYDWRREQPRLRCAVPSGRSSGKKGGSGGLGACAVSRDAHFFCAGAAGGGGEVYAWQLATGRLLRAFGPAHHRGVNCMQFTSDDAFLLTGGGDATFRVWATSELLSLDQPLERTDGALGNSDDTSAAGGRSSSVTPWHTFREHTLGVTGIACGLTGAAGRVATSSLDSTVKLWHLPARRMLASILFPSPLNDCCFDPTESRVFGAGADGRVFVADLHTARTIGDVGLSRTPPSVIGDGSGERQAVTGVATSSDGQQVMASCLDGTVSIYDVRSGQLVRELRVPQGAPVSGVQVVLRGSHNQNSLSAGSAAVRAVDMGMSVESGAGAPEAAEADSELYSSMLGGGRGGGFGLASAAQSSGKLDMSVAQLSKFAPEAGTPYEASVRSSAGALSSANAVVGDSHLVRQVASALPASVALPMPGDELIWSSGATSGTPSIVGSDSAVEIEALRRQNVALRAENARWKSLGSDLYGIAAASVVDDGKSGQ